MRMENCTEEHGTKNSKGILGFENSVSIVRGESQRERERESRQIVEANYTPRENSDWSEAKNCATERR